MHELKVKTFPASEEKLQAVLREAEKRDYKIEHLIFIGYNPNVEKLWTVVYRKKD